MGGIVRIEEEIRGYARGILDSVVSEDSLRDFLLKVTSGEEVEYMAIGSGNSPEGFVLIEVAYHNPCRGIEKRCRLRKVQEES